MKMIKIILGIFLACTYLLPGCKKTLTEPERIKTPREMTWTSITITSPDTTSFQVLPENLVVFSESDMWLVCWSDVARGLLWHYDGNQWRESNIFQDVNGMRVNDVAGYSSNDLWTAGYSGDRIFLAHYNGQHWIKWDNMQIKGELLDMTRDPNGNIWACGRNGVVLKYDKTKWIADTLRLHCSLYDEYFLKSIEYFGGKIYVLASTIYKNKDIYYYFCGDMENWTIADSMIIDSPASQIKWGQYGLYSNKANELFSYGPLGIWKYDNNKWDHIFNPDYQIMDTYVNNSNYMFAVGQFNHVYFSNGTSWNNISDVLGVKDPYFEFTNVWTNGYETVIVGYGDIDGVQKTVIWHGK